MSAVVLPSRGLTRKLSDFNLTLKGLVLTDLEWEMRILLDLLFRGVHKMLSAMYRNDKIVRNCILFLPLA